MTDFRRAIVFAHYDRDGLLDPHVHASLASLAATGAEIIFVSTNLAADESMAGTGVCRTVRRENLGYDFRSWQVGLKELDDLQTYDEVILMNDSFYLVRDQSLVAILKAFRRLPYDVGSLTASREFNYHLQSYFLVFRRAALRSPWFARFWNDVAPDCDREGAIRRYELPLASQARSEGLRVGALQVAPHPPSVSFVVEQAARKAKEKGWLAGIQAASDALQGVPGWNPTLDGWVATAKRCGVVKVELLRTNPRGADLSRLESIMEPACLMRARRHIARLAGPAAALTASAA